MVQKKLIFDFTIPSLYNAGIRAWSLDLLKLLKKSNLFQIIIVTPCFHEELELIGSQIIVPYSKYKIPVFHRFLYYGFSFKKALIPLKGIPILSPYFQLPKSILSSHYSIITIHDTLYYDLAHFYNRPDLFILKTITNFYHELNIKLAKNILTVSQFSQHRLSELFGVNCLEIVYNVPELKVIDNCNSGSYFVYFGGWEVRKRANIAMSIASLILENRHDVKFVVSGVSSFNFIKKYFSPNLMSRIIFEDRFSIKDLQYYYSNSFLSLYTSSFEGFGIPIFESQLYGVPVLICDDLIISQEIPVKGVIRFNIENFNKTSILEVLNNLIFYNYIEIQNEALVLSLKLRFHNSRIPKILYDVI